MYPRLARKLVEEGNWYMIRLSSGMQTPLLDAIRYIRERMDKESVHQLEKLRVKYSPRDKRLDVTFPFAGGVVTNHYGPADYIPKQIYEEINEALKALRK